ncbi:MAG: LacI family DNA-binding transcriptional regulator [Tepidisphaeraceae bacterium]
MSSSRVLLPKPSIKSIAETAGVSLATVSRVMNATAKVSERKVQSVYRAASMLGYQLPQRASSSTHFRTRNIALAYTGSSMQLAEWGFMDGIEAYFRKRDMRLVLTHLTPDGEVPSLFADHACDGVIVLANLVNIPESLLQIVKSFPCIQIVRGQGPLDCWDEVLTDNATIARIAIDYLAGLEARTFAFFNIHPDHESCVERGSYFEFFLQQKGIQPVMLTCEYEHAKSRPRHKLAEELVDRYLQLEQKPDGLFVPTDFQLPECYAALEARGIRPMKDVQIISCDNCERHLAMLSARPATIDQLMGEVGFQAARQLTWRIQNPTAAPLQVFIKPKLIPPPKN